MYNIHILIAEDEERLRKLVVKYLRMEGFKVFEAENGQKALDIFREENIDLVILDVMMPGVDGWSVCRDIRQNSEVPIIMLTARSEESDKIFGFELGVDDYVTKPFSTRELMARIKALLKRSGKNSTNDGLSIGDMVVNTKSRVVTIESSAIPLSPKEFDLLVYLIDNENIALSREQILDRIWGYDYFGDYRTVDTVVKRLRKKLLQEGERIVTVRGVGYRLEVK